MYVYIYMHIYVLDPYKLLLLGTARKDNKTGWMQHCTKTWPRSGEPPKSFSAKDYTGVPRDPSSGHETAHVALPSRQTANNPGVTGHILWHLWREVRKGAQILERASLLHGPRE